MSQLPKQIDPVDYCEALIEIGITSMQLEKFLAVHTEAVKRSNNLDGALMIQTLEQAQEHMNRVFSTGINRAHPLTPAQAIKVKAKAIRVFTQLVDTGVDALQEILSQTAKVK